MILDVGNVEASRKARTDDDSRSGCRGLSKVSPKERLLTTIVDHLAI